MCDVTSHLKETFANQFCLPWTHFWNLLDEKSGFYCPHESERLTYAELDEKDHRCLVCWFFAVFHASQVVLNKGKSPKQVEGHSNINLW